MTVHKVVRANGFNGDQIEAEVKTDPMFRRGGSKILVHLNGGADLNRGQWETFAQEVSAQISALVQDGAT